MAQMFLIALWASVSIPSNRPQKCLLATGVWATTLSSPVNSLNSPRSQFPLSTQQSASPSTSNLNSTPDPFPLVSITANISSTLTTASQLTLKLTSAQSPNLTSTPSPKLTSAPSPTNSSRESEVPSPSSCGEGLIHWGGWCYKFFEKMPPKSTRWDADNLCSDYGGRTFNLPFHDVRKWRILRKLLFRLQQTLKQKVKRYGSKRTVGFTMGLKSAKVLQMFPVMYQDSWVWSDHTVAHNTFQIIPVLFERSCASLLLNHVFFGASVSTDVLFSKVCASRADRVKNPPLLCEIGAPSQPSLPLNYTRIKIPPRELHGLGERFVNCWSHFTHSFLPCDVSSGRWAREQGYLVLGDYPVTPRSPFFACITSQPVPYTFVCDFQKDCADGSDEDFCNFTPCRPDREFACRNKQCIPYRHRCDRTFHCTDLSDEKRCQTAESGMISSQYMQIYYFISQGIFVSLSKFGTLTPQNVTNDFVCPETHFWCPDKTLCLPVFLRCNDVFDCPGHEDEAGCDSYTCPGYYRCRGSAACLSPRQLCDGVFQCPQRDDELLCGFSCPHNCTCYGMAFFCHGLFPAGEFPQLRFLDGRDSGLTPADLVKNTLLVHLSLPHCGLTRLSRMNHDNLLYLDLSDNALNQVAIEQVIGAVQLRELVLSRNLLVSSLFTTSLQNASLPSLSTLDLSQLSINTINTTVLKIFANVKTLNLSQSNVDIIQEDGLRSLRNLCVLDFRGCPMTHFPRDVFQGLENLQTVYADNYKLCCPATLPEGFNVDNCHSPDDEISSCKALLRSQAYRVFLFLFAGCSLVGNIGSFVYRIFYNSNANKTSFGIFVVHLCVADFLMGVYLTVIGVADQMFKGTYLWNDLVWTHSSGCNIAGFLSFLSSEVSVSFIGLITLDRFIVIRFPFTTRRFRPRSAHVAGAVVWFLGFLLAAVPMLPATHHWNFYSQTGICIPLPITRKEFPGQVYSFSVIIVLNFVLFLMIGMGQGLIYNSISKSKLSTSETSLATKDLTIARRLLAVVMSDFLCWFPIGLLGLLASRDVPIPGEVNVAMAILVLPINSALNPFLYTINTLLEKRRRVKDERLQQRLLMELNPNEFM